jgi:hypothetical protein
VRECLVVVGDGGVIHVDTELLGELQRRKLPQPTEQPFGPPAHEDDLRRVTLVRRAARARRRLDPHERAREHGQVAFLLARRDHGERVLLARARCLAVARDRAHEAARRGRRADRGAELHERLVEITRRHAVVERGHELARTCPQRLLPGGGLDVVRDDEHATEHARDVAVDERRPLAERDRGDRSSGVGADARHLA